MKEEFNYINHLKGKHNYSMVKYLAALFLVSISTNCWATCIVAVRMPNGTIYLAADSRQGLYSKGSNKPKYSDDACKIHKAGLFHYAMASNSAEFFEPAMDQICKNSKSSAELTYNFLALRQYYEAHLSRTYSHLTPEEKSQMIAGRPVGLVAIVYVENSIPRLFVFGYNIYNVSKGKVELRSQNYSEGNGVKILGSDSATKNYYKGDLKALNKLVLEKPVDNIKKIIKLEAAMLLDVGGDIDFVEFNKNGLFWHHQKKGCKG